MMISYCLCELRHQHTTKLNIKNFYVLIYIYILWIYLKMLFVSYFEIIYEMMEKKKQLEEKRQSGRVNFLTRNVRQSRHITACWRRRGTRVFTIYDKGYSSCTRINQPLLHFVPNAMQLLHATSILNCTGQRFVFTIFFVLSD